MSYVAGPRPWETARVRLCDGLVCSIPPIPPATRLLYFYVLDELHTTFASRYTKTVSLTELLDPAEIAVFAKRATGQKYLVEPNR